MVRDMKILQELVDSERTSFYTENFHAIDLAIKKLLKRLKDLKYIEQEHKEINGQLRERVKELEEENAALKKGVERLKHKKEKLSNELIDVKVDKVTKNFIPKSKIKEILIDQIEYRKFELQQEYKDFKDDGILNILQDIKEELLEE